MKKYDGVYILMQGSLFKLEKDSSFHKFLTIARHYQQRHKTKIYDLDILVFILSDFFLFFSLCLFIFIRLFFIVLLCQIAASCSELLSSAFSSTDNDSVTIVRAADPNM